MDDNKSAHRTYYNRNHDKCIKSTLDYYYENTEIVLSRNRLYSRNIMNKSKIHENAVREHDWQVYVHGSKVVDQIVVNFD